MPKRTSKSLGYAAEDAAMDWLTRQGYQVMERNVTFPGAEIDFVCTKDNLVIFVELKWRSGSGFGTPEEALTWTKRRALARAISIWCSRRGGNPEMVRFDFLAAEGRSGGTTEWRLYENVELG